MKTSRFNLSGIVGHDKLELPHRSLGARILVLLAVITIYHIKPAAAGTLYWRVDGTGGTLTSSNWSSTGSAPYASAWVNSSNIDFAATSAITNVTNIPVGNITVEDNATVTWTAAGTFNTGGTISTVTIGNNASLVWNAQNVSTTAGTGFIKSGNGIWNIGAQSNAYTGGFTLNAGTVIVSGNNALGAGALTINGGTIQSSGTRSYAPTGITVGGDFTFSGTGTSTWAANIALGASNRTITVGTGADSVTENLNGVISGGVGVSLTIKAGGTSNAVTLGNASNSFSGGLVIAGGEVDVSSDGALGAAGGSVTINGGRLGIATNSFAIDPTRSVLLGANPTGGNTSGTLSIKGSITTTYDGAFQDLNGGTVGDLVKQGGGTLQMGGVSTYSGSTFLNNGITKLTTGSDRLPTGTTVNIGQAASANLGTLDLNGFNQRIAGLNSTAGTNSGAGKNTVTNNGSADSILTIGGGGTYSYGDGTAASSGIIKDGLTNKVSLVKSGAGTQILGDANTYTGDTDIQGGRLTLTSTGSLTSKVTVEAGASFSDSGTVSGHDVVLKGDGSLYPGDLGTTSVSTITGQLITETGSNVYFDIGGTARGTQYDAIDGLTGVTLGGTLDVILNGYDPVLNDTFTLLDLTGAGSANDAGYGFDFSRAVLTDPGLAWYAGDFLSTGSISVVATATPEPTRMMLLAVGCGTAGLRRRRR